MRTCSLYSSWVERLSRLLTTVQAQAISSLDDIEAYELVYRSHQGMPLEL